MFALEATVWHEILAEVFNIFSDRQFPLLLRGELIFPIVKLRDWLFLLDMNFCNFQEVAFSRNKNSFFFILKYFTYNQQVKQHVEMLIKVISITIAIACCRSVVDCCGIIPRVLFLNERDSGAYLFGEHFSGNHFSVTEMSILSLGVFESGYRRLDKKKLTPPLPRARWNHQEISSFKNYLLRRSSVLNRNKNELPSKEDENNNRNAFSYNTNLTIHCDNITCNRKQGP